MRRILHDVSWAGIGTGTAAVSLAGCWDSAKAIFVGTSVYLLGQLGTWIARTVVKRIGERKKAPQ